MEHDEKKIEAIIDKLMDSDTLETPSINFTDHVMSKVSALDTTSTSHVYKPLISKSVLIGIGIAVIVLLSYFIFNQPAGDSNLLEKYNLAFNFENPLGNLNFNFSKTLVYAFGLLAIMLSIQIPVLKHYFNKQFKL